MLCQVQEQILHDARTNVPATDTRSVRRAGGFVLTLEDSSVLGDQSWVIGSLSARQLTDGRRLAE